MVTVGLPSTFAHDDSRNHLEYIHYIEKLIADVEQAKMLGRLQLDSLRLQLEEKDSESIKASQDRCMENGESQKTIEDLRQQVTARSAELEKERKKSAEGAERMKALERELSGIKADRVVELNTLQEESETRLLQLHKVQEESELTLLQLHQAQEELEHYFILSRKQSKMLEDNEKLQARAAVLLSNAVG